MKSWITGTASASAMALALTGCASSPGQSGTSVDPASSATPTAVASGTPTPSRDPARKTTYALGPESIVRIGRDGAVLLAERGRVTVSGSADTGILVAVVAENESGSPDWRLDLAVSAQGRVESGELVEDGTTWTIQAQTGLIASQIDTQFVDVESDRAVTVRSSAAGPNVPMTFRIVGRTS